MTTALALSAKALASLSSLEPPAGHRLSGLTAGENIFAGAACHIQDDGEVYLSWAAAADFHADVHGYAWRSVKLGGSITLGFNERMHMFDAGVANPGVPLFLSDDVTTKGRLQLTPGPGSPIPCAFTIEDGQRIYCLQNVGLYNMPAANSAELAAFIAAIPVAALADLAATTNILAVPGVFADVAAVRTYLADAAVIPNIEARLDNLEAKVNATLARLRTAAILTP